MATGLIKSPSGGGGGAFPQVGENHPHRDLSCAIVFPQISLNQ